ncbi:MAG: PLP-dependent aspartate aminotransferase family protein [Chloroflexota bacterium]|nr:PLP-dependent aspartate aminotransferase family protein [Chloroflexota bacterium]
MGEAKEVDLPHIGRGFTTRAVHAGERPLRLEFTPTVTPIYPSVSYLADDPETQDAVFGGEREGYVYTRHGNPTTRALEIAVAALEETEDAVAFGSGMGALLAAILNEVQAGQRIVASRDLYGATQALLGNVFATLGVKTTFVDILDRDEVARVLAEIRPRILLFETISNPLVRVADIPALVAIARRSRVKTIVDNTFATPLLVNPARFGVDTVVHSTTKYLGGHGDATGGVVATTRERALEIGELTKLTGAVLGPFEAWLTLRGVKTLSLRMQRQCENAAALAAWLSQHPRIARVYYPGHDERGETAQVFNNDLRGGIVAFDIAEAGREEVFCFLRALRICLPVTTLGDVYTMVLYPAVSTHRTLSPQERAGAGIGDGLVRLSAGIEDVADLIEDLDRALAIR